MSQHEENYRLWLAYKSSPHLRQRILAIFYAKNAGYLTKLVQKYLHIASLKGLPGIREWINSECYLQLPAAFESYEHGKGRTLASHWFLRCSYKLPQRYAEDFSVVQPDRKGRRNLKQWYAEHEIVGEVDLDSEPGV